jgi:hypothetical protein
MRWSFQLVALAAFAFGACGGGVSAGAPTATTWGAVHGDLRLGVEVEGGALVVRLENRGSRPLHVLSHVDAGDRHFDSFAVELTDPAGGKRTLHFMDARNESARVTTDLAPGKELSHRIDLQAWARRSPNGAKPIAAGSYRASVAYVVAGQPDVWNGSLSAGPVTLSIP